mmetsp:Transcript_55735/g.67191  ORF Transcript_55735/g.67191 Transcript_55735/m.67191 type:complete len:134 (+) Transcript_55735:94-495(+)
MFTLAQYEAELVEAKTSYGEMHPTVAEILNTIALHHFHLGNNADWARLHHMKALFILRQCARTDSTSSIHDAIAVTLVDVGNTFLRDNELDKAKASFKEALDILSSKGRPTKLQYNSYCFDAARRGLEKTSYC